MILHNNIYNIYYKFIFSVSPENLNTLLITGLWPRLNNHQMYERMNGLMNKQLNKKTEILIW